MQLIKLPATGPLAVTDYNKYLEAAKEDFDKKYKTNFRKKGLLDDFEKVRTLGIGSFGRVVLVKHKLTEEYYAMKVMKKKQLVKTKQIENTLNEKRILTCINNPFVLTLEYFHMDNSYVYLTMPFIAGGELFTHLRKFGKFEEPLVRFYAAQVVLALEYLHFLDLIHRDIKPENILIDNTGYLKLADFGFCKQVKTRTWTLCGTQEYLAPEIILSKGYGKAVDWWSFGVLVYEMSTGRPPFTSREPMRVYEKIVVGRYAMPDFFSPNLKDLVKNLLQKDLSRRYGNLKNGINDIKDHKWFQETNWLSVFNRKETPPHVPEYSKPGDVSNFDVYPEEKIRVSSNNRYQKEFADF